MYDKRFVTEVSRLQHAETPYCTVTIVDARGSIPQEVGASAVFGREGLLFGTIGGGRVELRCAEQVREMLAREVGSRTRFERLNLHRDVGMTCAGEVALYYEMHRPQDRWNIVVFGAGHVSQKLCRFLVELDCSTVCVDTRIEWLAQLPKSDRLEIRHVPSFVEGVDSVRHGAAVVVMTMGQATDAPILEALAQCGASIPFLGVIGSASKASIMRRHLLRSGVPPTFVDAISCPIGEKLGDNTPAEIATAVLSELVKARRASSNSASRIKFPGKSLSMQRMSSEEVNVV